jgi:hypothetical protein
MHKFFMMDSSINFFSARLNFEKYFYGYCGVKPPYLAVAQLVAAVDCSNMYLLNKTQQVTGSIPVREINILLRC